MRYNVIIEKDEDGVYIASCPMFKSCHTYGYTCEEAIENIKDVIRMCCEEMEAEGPQEILNPKYVDLIDIEIELS